MSAPSAPRNEPETPPAVRVNGRDGVFNRTLRYEIVGEEGRALLGSYMFSFALGIGWLLFVYFGPLTQKMQLLSPDERPIAVTFEALDPYSTVPEAGDVGPEVRLPAPGPRDRSPGPRGDRAGRARPGNAA